MVLHPGLLAAGALRGAHRRAAAAGRGRNPDAGNGSGDSTRGLQVIALGSNLEDSKMECPFLDHAFRLYLGGGGGKTSRLGVGQN